VAWLAASIHLPEGKLSEAQRTCGGGDSFSFLKLGKPIETNGAKGEQSPNLINRLGRWDGYPDLFRGKKTTRNKSVFS